MTRTELLKGLGVFALVVLVIVSATVATGTIVSESPESENVNASAYDDALRLEPADDSGSVEPAVGNGTKTVIIDKSHGNAVTEGGLQPMVDALVSAGHDVRFYTGGSSNGLGTGGLSSSSSGLNATLRSADAFVVVNPASSYTASESNGVEAFADAGGRVLMLADPVGQTPSGTSLSLPIGTSTGDTATPGQPTNLAARFEISFGAGYLFDMTDNVNNFQRVYADSVADGPLTAGVDRLVVNDATPLAISGSSQVVAESVDVRASATRRSGTYPVAARTGNVTAVGDTEFLQPASATLADNEAFVSNLADFLVSGEKSPGVPEPAEPSSGTGTGGFTPPTQPGTTPTLPGNGTSTPTNGTSP
ncbi:MULTISPECIES: DUF4350 domain-containing protein [Salinibaculum]|uniref:DUF4350 domain-containing protein n=1 Tax=Salinibaculum TaxID=2732368 RepID=UPI0030CEEE40